MRRNYFDLETFIREIKLHLNVKLDREVADELGVDPSTVATWRRRGKVPKGYQLSLYRAIHWPTCWTVHGIKYASGKK